MLSNADSTLSGKRHVYVHASLLGSHNELPRDAMIQSSEAPERTIDRSKIAGFFKLGKPRTLGCPHENPPAHGAARSDGCIGCRLLSTAAAASPGHHDLQLSFSCRATKLHAMGTPHPRLHPPQTCVMHEHGTFEGTSPILFLLLRDRLCFGGLCGATCGSFVLRATSLHNLSHCLEEGGLEKRFRQPAAEDLWICETSAAG
jgi:hypothetical protein